MVLSPFLVVLSGRDDRGAGVIRWRWRSRWRRVRIGSGHGCAVRRTMEDGHQTGNDDDDGPTVVPGENARGIEQEENADENDPYRAAKGAKEPELVAGTAVIGEAGASVGHSADEDPDAEADQNYWDEPMSGKGVEESRVADEKQATKSDEPDRASGETITRKRRKIGVDGVSGRSIRMNRGDWWHGGNVVVRAVPGCVPVCGSGLRGIRVGRSCVGA